jgi:protein-S-isoprenylcysteine O-methyltransferase Ste14
MFTTLKWVAFLILTIIIIVISKKSLVKIHSHGFFRFFAWEFILLLFLLNVGFWFVKPFSLNQIISWTLLISSTYYVLEGFRLLRTKGGTTEKRPEEHLYKLEKTDQLVTEGIYRYIRHPMYGSLLFLAWGIFFKSVSFTGFFLVMGASICLFLTAIIEEKENLNYFGDAYTVYRKRTKMFIPYIW